jgi:hypothetical protein
MLAAAAFLLFLGAVVVMYSYGQLEGQVVLFDQSSMQIDGHSYFGYQARDVNLDGKYAAMVIGGVGGTGYAVDFYLVNDTSWNSWSMNPGMRSAFSMVHLNSSVVSSQSISGQFSFVPPASAGYSIVLVNDEYPNASNASINVHIALRCDSLDTLYAIAAGLAILASGLVLLALPMVRKARTLS